MNEQKIIKSFSIVCKHLEKIDKENESIRKELKSVMDKLDELQTCFDTLFRQSLN